MLADRRGFDSRTSSDQKLTSAQPGSRRARACLSANAQSRKRRSSFSFLDTNVSIPAAFLLLLLLLFRGHFLLSFPAVSIFPRIKQRRRRGRAVLLTVCPRKDAASLPRRLPAPHRTHSARTRGQHILTFPAPRTAGIRP